MGGHRLLRGRRAARVLGESMKWHARRAHRGVCDAASSIGWSTTLVEWADKLTVAPTSLNEGRGESREGCWMGG